MRIFLTGATGFIGTALIPELLAAGHQILGLTRSEAGAQSLTAAGVEPHRGSLEEPATLTAGASGADAVIHCAFDHDFANFVANCEKERHAIAALGSALKGSNRPLLITSGTGLGSPAPGQLATEDHYDTNHPNPRRVSEEAGTALLESGLNVSFLRLPQVHDTVKQGLITYSVAVARQKGISAYIGEGLNRWPAAHVSDVARLYKLAIEKPAPGLRYHAVAEEGISAREIAQALGEGLKIPVVSLTPEEAPAYFGWMAMFASMDMPASSALTQQRLNWHPTGPTLLEDLKAMNYNA